MSVDRDSVARAIIQAEESADPVAIENAYMLVELLRATPASPPSIGEQSPETSWLRSTADLLHEPHPGPVPFLVDGVVLDPALLVVQGAEKVGKSYLLIETAICVVTGLPLFDTYAVANTGPVILVMEETGQDAFYRRVDKLRCGAPVRTRDRGGNPPRPLLLR